MRLYDVPDHPSALGNGYYWTGTSVLDIRVVTKAVASFNAGLRSSQTGIIHSVSSYLGLCRRRKQRSVAVLSASVRESDSSRSRYISHVRNYTLASRG